MILYATPWVAILAGLVAVSGSSSFTRSCDASKATNATCFQPSHLGSNALINKYGRLASALTTFAWPVRKNVVLQARKTLRDLSLSSACRETMLQISNDMFKQKPWAMQGTLLNFKFN